VESKRDCAVDDRLVAEVEAVEIAEREDAPLKALGHRLVVGQSDHLVRGCIGRACRPQLRPGDA
jgi:hypothetical protein